jgi:hypothetical protein
MMKGRMLNQQHEGDDHEEHQSDHKDQQSRRRILAQADSPESVSGSAIDPSCPVANRLWTCCRGGSHGRDARAMLARSGAAIASFSTNGPKRTRTGRFVPTDNTGSIAYSFRKRSRSVRDWIRLTGSFWPLARIAT